MISAASLYRRWNLQLESRGGLIGYKNNSQNNSQFILLVQQPGVLMVEGATIIDQYFWELWIIKKIGACASRVGAVFARIPLFFSGVTAKSNAAAGSRILRTQNPACPPSCPVVALREAGSPEGEGGNLQPSTLNLWTLRAAAKPLRRRREPGTYFSIYIPKLRLYTKNELIPFLKPWCCKSRGCCSFKASKVEAVVAYCNLLATQKMQYHRLSFRVNNRTIYLLFIPFIFSKIGDADLISHKGLIT